MLFVKLINIRKLLLILIKLEILTKFKKNIIKIKVIHNMTYN